MPVPEPIGPIHFSEPRAVRIRLRDDKEPHSAVHGDLNVEVETAKEAKLIIDAWRIIMQKAADEAEAILSAFRVANGGVPVGINPETGFPE